MEKRAKVSAITRMQTIAIILVLIIAALVGYIAYSTFKPAPTTTKNVIMQLDWIPGGPHLYLYAAKDLYWPQLGLNVEIVRGQGSGDTALKIGQGTVQFGAATFDAGVNVRATQTLLVKCIANFVSGSDMGYFWIKRDNGRGIIDKNNLTTLEGKVFAEPVYGAGHVQSAAFAQKAGFNWSKVQYVSMDPGATVSALIAGSVDFVSPGLGEQFSYQNSVRQALGDAVANECDWLWFKDYGFKMLGDSLWTSDQMINTDPDTVAKFVQGAQQGWKYTCENLNASVANFIKDLPEWAGQESVLANEFIGRFQYVANMTMFRANGAGYLDPDTVHNAVLNTYAMYGITDPSSQLPSWQDAYSDQFIHSDIFPTTTPWGA
jgi:NitT/TauT family transport system substrate-binding protein